MKLLKYLLALAAIALLPSLAHAQSWKDRIRQGAGVVREGAGIVKDGAETVGRRIEESAESTVDLLSNEATPEETRAELDAMATATLDRLLAERPEASDLFTQSAGFAVFDTRKLTLAGVSAGAGRGVAVSRDIPVPVYMNMGTAGLGLSFGIGGFETQVVILFESKERFDEFITYGYDATAEAGSMFGDDKASVETRWIDGRAMFYLTDQGWKVSASAAGTKYWLDPNLN